MKRADREKTIRRIASFLSREDFAVERRNKEGKIEKIVTPFDKAIIGFELYDLTKSPIYLEENVPYLVEKVQQREGSMRWSHSAPRSSPKLPPFPPDADTTAFALLVLQQAAKAGVSIPQEYLNSGNNDQFEELLHPEGIRTWFGDFGLDEQPDVAVTSAVALYFAHAALEHRIYNHLRTTLNRRVQQFDDLPKQTQYYPCGKYYALLRIAEIARDDHEFLGVAAQKALHVQVEKASLENALEAAFVGRAAALCGIQRKADEAKDFLMEQRQGNGLWPFVPFYNQKTSWYYGHEAITTIFAVSALREIEK